MFLCCMCGGESFNGHFVTLLHDTVDNSANPERVSHNARCCVSDLSWSQIDTTSVCQFAYQTHRCADSPAVD